MGGPTISMVFSTGAAQADPTTRPRAKVVAVRAFIFWVLALVASVADVVAPAKCSS